MRYFLIVVIGLALTGCGKDPLQPQSVETMIVSDDFSSYPAGSIATVSGISASTGGNGCLSIAQYIDGGAVQTSSLQVDVSGFDLSLHSNIDLGKNTRIECDVLFLEPVTGLNLSPNTWYPAKLITNSIADTYEIFVNNVSVKKGNTPDGLDLKNITIYGIHGSFRLDNLKIFTTK